MQSEQQIGKEELKTTLIAVEPARDDRSISRTCRPETPGFPSRQVSFSFRSASGALSSPKLIYSPAMPSTIPDEPTSTQRFLKWTFFFFVGTRDWDGLVHGKAEVHGSEGLRCSFSLVRHATRKGIEEELKLECYAWTTEHARRLPAK